MNCLDCNHAGIAASAVAICHGCGAGVCVDHAVVRDHHLTRTATINRIIVVDPPARLVRCLVCTTAHDAAHDQAEPHHQLFADHPAAEIADGG
jgi:hypothetical protein